MIPLFKVHMPKDIDESLLQVMHSGFIGQGPKVIEFEEKLAAFLGRDNVLSLNSGTSGLHLAVRLSNVGPGDEVICTPMTCTASNMPVLANGANIVWADVDKTTGLITPESIEKNITEKTRAIIVVHFGGHVCDMKSIYKIANARNIKVIEDAAHAFGSSYNDSGLGEYSDFVMYSFQAIKHISTIDGGALICKDASDYARGKLLRWYGIDRESPRSDFRCEENITEFGYKFHMNDVCATVGIKQLEYAENIVSKHRDNAKYYDQALRGIKGVQLINPPEGSSSSYWLYTIHVERREELMNYLEENGISSSRVHERNDIHDAFKASLKLLPGVDAFNATQLSIPVGWWVTDENRAYIVDRIREFYVSRAQHNS